MQRISWLVALGLCGAHCVSKKKYTSLQQERDDIAQKREAEKQEAGKQIGELRLTNTSLENALVEERATVADLTERVNKLTADIAAVTKDKSRLQGSVEEMTKALMELEKRRAQAEARVQEFKSLLARFRSLIDAGKLQVRIVEGRMVVVLATDILFASGSASLSKEGKAAISEVSKVLASIPTRTFQVEGHTDNVPISTAQFPTNWELASARALTVVKTMIDAGMPMARISAASFGETHPIAGNQTNEGRAQNRRIEIIIVPDLSGLPGFEELKKL